jgi:hypothetical protein
MIMETLCETDAGKEESGGLYLELGRILLKIHRKWQLSGAGEEDRSNTSSPFEELETAFIPADSETVQQAIPVEEELTETVILAPVVFGKTITTAVLPLDEVPETVIITPCSEENLDETILLPPKQERLKRREGR